MTSSAAIQKHDVGGQLPVLLEIAFMVCVLLCFVRVASYVVGRMQRGRLLINGNQPMDFTMHPLTGWLFVGGVMAFVFWQSVCYVFLVFMGIAGLLVENGRTADEQFGFQRLPLAQVLKWSLLVCGAFIFIETPISQVWLWGMDSLHIPHPDQQSVEAFRSYRKPLEIIAFMVQAVILFPMVEELFFRGFLLTFIKKYTTTWLALILSAGVFAFAHANLGAVLPLWILGVILGVAYQHTGSLLLPMAIHSCWNLFTAVSLLYEKGSG